MSDGGGEDAFKSVYQKAKKQSQAIKQHYIAQGSCHVVNASQGPNAVFAEIAVRVGWPTAGKGVRMPGLRWARHFGVSCCRVDADNSLMCSLC